MKMLPVYETPSRMGILSKTGQIGRPDFPHDGWVDVEASFIIIPCDFVLDFFL